MTFNMTLPNILASLCVLTSFLFAMEADETLEKKGLNSARNGYLTLSQTEKQEIEELGKKYYLLPHKFTLTVTITDNLPSEIYPIGIAFRRDQATSRTILLNNALSILPECTRLSGHSDKRLPSYWYYPAETHYAYTSQG